MSYEPTEWKSGDVISSAKLNKMEQGIASDTIYIIHATADNKASTEITVDTEVSAIFTALENGLIPVLILYETLNQNSRYFYIKEYSMPDPSTEYDGYLHFVSIPHIYNPNNTQLNLKADDLVWDMSWTLERRDVMLTT